MLGGFEEGIRRATNGKWECIGFSEIDKYAIATYTKHFPSHKNWGNAREINPNELPDFDLLCCGFPCQSFSIAGKRKGFQDTRGTLFYEICRIVAVKRPQFLFLENVKGLLSADSGRCFATILSSLDELGYDVEWEVLNSKHFGVPQNRERVFIIGHSRSQPSRQIFPLGTDDKTTDDIQRQQAICNTLTQRYEGAQATGSYIFNTISTGSTHTVGTYVVERKQHAQEIRQPKILLKSATSEGYSECEEGDGVRLEYPSSTTARGRVIKQKSNTLKSGTEGVFHNGKIRRLTPVECARLQGFSDDWCVGSDSQKYKQLGNAVTVNVITAIVTKLERLNDEKLYS